MSGADGSAPVRAVLFDMDGLLVATEETWFEAETEVMAWLGGVPWSRAHQAALVGGPMARTTAYLIEVAERPDADPDEVATRLLDSMQRRLLEGPVHWMPGARRLLDEVAAAGLPAALVSSSYRRVVDAVLDAIGRDAFAVTVSADDVARTKPHPDPYLAAAAALGLDARSCVALEDSVTGARAATEAGCVTVVVPSVTDVPAGTGHAVVPSLAEVDLAWLAALAAEVHGAG